MSRLFTVLCLFACLETYAQKEVSKNHFDPDFHIYLCFGQSNMEGVATPSLEDYAGRGHRFLTMAALDMPVHERVMGHWYEARSPLCKDHTGLTPIESFGRAMLDNLPDNISIGVIDVAQGGCSIDFFDEDKCAAYLASDGNWLIASAALYDYNPFRRLVDLAKEAQKVGVIKGVLMHQGEANEGQLNWPQRVKKVYDALLQELNLSPDTVPLLAGEMLRKEQGGISYAHNTILARLPKVIPTAHVVSSQGCPGAYDGQHFTTEGYHLLGEHYAQVMLSLLHTTSILAPRHDPSDTQKRYDLSGRRSNSNKGHGIHIAPNGKKYVTSGPLSRSTKR